MSGEDADRADRGYAERWCAAQGSGWSVVEMLGRGGTAPVFRLTSPGGDRAFKLLDIKFSKNELGRQTELRIKQQVDLGEHDCPFLVICYNGGRIDDRLYLLMSCANGQELEKRLNDVPRAKIRQIVDQVTQAVMYLRNKGLSHRDIKSANVFISDDFQHATLLDLSVMRDINDPVGIGTDHDNQLPVVATSRYTPPEYLFRLQDPSPELWHGVDVYQLGGLLHDLIMREPMFTSEYAASSENRYRFAWIVATIDPLVAFSDVDADLVLLARRALDKNWDRRRILKLEDFRDDPNLLSPSLAAIGLAPTPRQVNAAPKFPLPAEIRDFGRQIDEHVTAMLSQRSITARHTLEPGETDQSVRLQWQWSPNGGNVADEVCLDVSLTVTLADPLPRISLTETFKIKVDGTYKISSMQLPDRDYDLSAADDVSRSVFVSLGQLANIALSSNGEL